MKIPRCFLQQISNVRRFASKRMANTKFEYIKSYESDDKLLQNCWIIVRLDGQSFHKFSTKHKFQKPNDTRALDLMNFAAVQVLREFRDIVLAFGQSDEYSFVFHKSTDLHNRRASKLMSGVCSLFSSAYVMYWSDFFPATKLLYPPSFDGRTVLYPSDENLRDYLSWRQADTHINNLYNTTFWSLVMKGGLSNREAMERLKGTVSADKNEILFSEFGLNYNNEAPMFRKGTVLVRKQIKVPPDGSQTRQVVIPLHEDLIQDAFWKRNSEVLDKSQPKFLDLQDEKLPLIVRKQIEET